MHLIYKSKGDMADLNNYRRIMVNNSISKVFTSLLNDRLNKLVEESDVLGQIQNGGCKGRMGMDSLFILRTILEKTLATKMREASFLFVNLAKAYDSVPHDLLWTHLRAMGFHNQFIRLLKSLYKDCTARVLVNGHETNKVQVWSGVKQGCPLSPLLFALYLTDILSLLEHNPASIHIFGQDYKWPAIRG